MNENEVLSGSNKRSEKQKIASQRHGYMRGLVSGYIPVVREPGADQALQGGVAYYTIEIQAEEKLFFNHSI
jgi:hypothetical protein